MHRSDNNVDTIVFGDCTCESSFLSSLIHLLFLKKICIYLILGFQGRFPLCSLDCVRTHSEDQVSLDLRDLPASDSLVLELKTGATTA